MFLKCNFEYSVWSTVRFIEFAFYFTSQESILVNYECRHLDSSLLSLVAYRIKSGKKCFCSCSILSENLSLHARTKIAFPRRKSPHPCPHLFHFTQTSFPTGRQEPHIGISDRMKHLSTFWNVMTFDCDLKLHVFVPALFWVEYYTLLKKGQWGPYFFLEIKYVYELFNT